MASYQILIVDDEAAVRDLFSDLFRKEGYAVKCAASGSEALEIFTKEDFEVTLLDIKLPDMSGLEILKRIKDMKPQAVVIMITGFGYDEELIAKSREYGCSGYIGKNMPISQIMNSFKLFLKTAKEKQRENKG